MQLANRILALSILVITIMVFSDVRHLDKEVEEVEVEVEGMGGEVREKGSERRGAEGEGILV